MNISKVDMRRGGLATSLKYDMRERGRNGGLKGGRPRLKSYSEMIKETKYNPNNLKELKKACIEHIKKIGG